MDETPRRTDAGVMGHPAAKLPLPLPLSGALAPGFLRGRQRAGGISVRQADQPVGASQVQADWVRLRFSVGSVSQSSTAGRAPSEHR